MSSALIKPNKKTVFVSGNFFVLHPGHIRLLKFASECGYRLFVGVNDTRPNKDYPSAEERADTLRELGLVHEVIVLREGLEKYLRNLKPDLVVKGKEYEGGKNPEENWVGEWGGKLLFTSGDAAYSGSILLRDSYFDKAQIWRQPKEYIVRHNCSRESLLPIVDQFKKLKIAVIGDLIVDEYIQCEALGMSREDPTLVVSPQEVKRFLGGAGIVAAHCKSMGADVYFFSAFGRDEVSNWAKQILSSYGVDGNIYYDDSRPTTLKQRYRVGSKTMMRVSELRQHEIGADIQNQIYIELEKKIKLFDLLIFSDFNYGVLPQVLVDKIIQLAKRNNVYLAADSQASSQMGDITRFKEVDLVTPTEYEARVSLRNQVSGLHIIANELMTSCRSRLGVITLGEAGSLIIDENLNIDRLPSLNPNPMDISGAGDSMLVATSMGRVLGLNPYQAAYVGAIASAIQVGRIGNIPISFEDIEKAFV